MAEGSSAPESHDGENPYTPPQSAPVAASTLPFTVYDVFMWSWSIFSARMNTCLSIFWGIVGVNFVVDLFMIGVLEALESNVRNEYVYKSLYIVVVFLNYVFHFWLVIGLTIAMIKIARDELVSIEDVTSGGPSLLTVILAWVIRWILFGVPIAVAVGVILGGFALFDLQLGVASALLFLVVSSAAGVVFIIVAARLSIYWYLVIDQGAGVFSSLLESWRLTRDLVGTITLVYCVQFAVFLAGVLALCFGLVFALPLATLIDTVLYLAIVTGATSGGLNPRFSTKESTQLEDEGNE